MRREETKKEREIHKEKDIQRKKDIEKDRRKRFLILKKDRRLKRNNSR